MLLIHRDRARCTTKSIRKQGRQQSKTKNNKTDKHMRDLKKIKQICHYNIIPSDLPKWVFLGQTETVFDETKIISQWRRRSRRNGMLVFQHLASISLGSLTERITSTTIKHKRQ